MRSLLLAALALPACGAAPRVPESAENASGSLEHAMHNCPSTVEDAHTRVAPVDGGIALEITASDPDAVVEIRELARYHAQIDAKHDRLRHTGGGTGGGRIGHCPVVHPGAEVTTWGIPNGARIVMRARDPGDVGALRERVLQRVHGLTEVRAQLSQRASASR